ncbi:4-coumarate--CoA ligase-like 7 [Chionoecetes opilio]|uniref:4-coumarate--CoA ligase-like 7 n=1 Tax=Chionoecetes opilio TaxID=41210 RepID=A0A8J4XRU0_CHIOP|nr:4-coumarate--CoA ligase-like 7 [Chionoecetes opilio]
MVPPMLNFLTSSDQVTPADLESVRGAMCSAAPVPSTTAKLFKEKAPHPVTFQEGFGMTETLGTHMTPLDDERLGYCGKVAPNVEAKVISEEGKALPRERGESFASGVHRLKELIKVKGFQVAPSELEDVLLQHSGVMDVAVVGVPDDRAGELPRAYVVRSPSSCTEDDIHKFLKERLADFKQLKGGVRFVDALPKSPTGKVLRRELQAVAAKDL